MDGTYDLEWLSPNGPTHPLAEMFAGRTLSIKRPRRRTLRNLQVERALGFPTHLATSQSGGNEHLLESEAGLLVRLLLTGC